MLRHVLNSKLVASALLATVLVACGPAGEKQAASGGPPVSTTTAEGVPQFRLNTNWPKPLPNNWMFGPVTGVYGDSHGLVWIASQSNMISAYDAALDKATGDCCAVGPQIMAFDQEGNLVKSWYVSVPPPPPPPNPNSEFTAPTMPNAKVYPTKCDGFKCLEGVHTIYVDSKDNVWVVGHGGPTDTQVLKFDYNGKFLLQIGGSDAPGCCGNQDENNLEGGTGVAYWPATNEVFVTDGYTNRRIIVFDADTGKFKRMWGAYGKPPSMSAPNDKGKMVSPSPTRVFEGPGADQWNTVHGVSITPDGVVWVADRVGNRLQQFKIDGTFIKEAFVSRQSRNGTGTVYGFAFSADGKYVYVPDGGNKKIHILDRNSLQEVGYVGGCGGQMPGCFNHVHVATTDTAGNLYTGEAAAGARVQRWDLVK